MAFSTFRFFFESGSAPIVPVSYFFDASRIVNDTTNSIIAQNGFYFIPTGSISTSYGLFNDSSGNIRANVITTQTGGPSVSIGTSYQLVPVASRDSTNSSIIGANIDSNHFVNAYFTMTGGSLFMVAQYITNTSGVLSITQTYTSSTAVGSSFPTNVDLSYITLDSTHGLLAAIGTTTQQIEMINPVAGTLYTTGTGTWTSTTNSIWGVSITASLAAYVYVNSSKQITISTIDISGSTITVNTAVSFTSSTVNNTSTIVGVSQINSTQILLTYIKSNSIFGSVVVDLAIGGSVTYHTESTVTMASAFPSSGVGQPVQLSSSQYMIPLAYNNISSGTNPAGQYQAFDLSITGTIISIQSVSAVLPFPAAMISSYNASNYNRNVMSSPLASSKVLIAYNTSTQNTSTFPNGSIIRIIPVETGTSPAWSSSWTGNGNITNLTFGNTPTTEVSAFMVGGDVLFTAFTSGSTSNLYTMDLDYNTAYLDATVTDGNSSVTQVTNISLPPVDTGNGRNRVIVGYLSSTTFSAEINELTSTGSWSTFGASTSIDTLVSNIKPIFGVLSNNTVIAIYVKTLGIYAAIITTNADKTISSISTPTLVYSSASMTSCPINITVINSSTVLATFQPGATGSAFAEIISISGSTITNGTAATIPSNPKSPVSSCLLTGSNGIMTYVDNSTSNMQGVTYSYSGTTLTLSSATAFTTSGTIKGLDSPSGSLVTTDSSDAVCLFYDTTGTKLIATLLNSTGQGNFSAGTNYTISTAISSANITYANLITGTNSKIVGTVGTATSASMYVVQLYRV